MKCRQCGEELPTNFRTDICLKCSEQNVRKIFKEHPEVKEAFKESVEEMKKPENMQRMVNNTCKFISAIQNLRSS